MNTREEKIYGLEESYSKIVEDAPYNWPSVMTPQGYMNECNFGGKYIIVSNDGESAVVWSDWNGDAIDDCVELVDMTAFTDEDGLFESGFILDGNQYLLNDFLRIYKK